MVITMAHVFNSAQLVKQIQSIYHRLIFKLLDQRTLLTKHKKSSYNNIKCMATLNEILN